jgi:hypothetical protein
MCEQCTHVHVHKMYKISIQNACFVPFVHEGTHASDGDSMQRMQVVTEVR